MEIVGCVLQIIKNVIFITEEITERCCHEIKFAIDLCFNGSEFRQHPLTNNLIVSFNWVITKIIIVVSVVRKKNNKKFARKNFKVKILTLRYLGIKKSLTVKIN